MFGAILGPESSASSFSQPPIGLFIYGLYERVGVAKVGLLNFRYESKPVEHEVVKIAEDVFPDLWQGRVAPDYRLMIVREFRNQDGLPPKPNRDQNETRYDQAIYKLDDVINRDGKGTIAGCALNMYDERDGATEQFIDHLVEIDERATKAID